MTISRVCAGSNFIAREHVALDEAEKHRLEQVVGTLRRTVAGIVG